MTVEGYMRNKSFFVKFFKDILLTLVVPLITIFFLYLQAESLIKEQILHSNQNILSHFFELMNVDAEEMKKTSISIRNEEKCQEYAKNILVYPARIDYLTLEIKTVLEQYMDEKYYDVFVYYPFNDKIISANNTSLKSEDYYNIYYGSELNNYKDEFYDVLQSDSKTPVFHVMNRSADRPFLCTSMGTYNWRDEREAFVVVLVLKPDYLTGIMAGKHEVSELLIFDSTKEFLLSSSTTKQDYHLEGYNGSEVPYEVSFGGVDYMMQVQEMENIRSFYAIATPQNYFWEKLSKMRNIYAVGGVICMLVSLAVAYRGSKRSYRPLESMVQRIQKYTNISYDSHIDTEFEFIEGILERESREKSELLRKSKKGECARLDNFLLTLLEENVLGNQFCENDFLEHGIVLCSDKFIVGILDVKGIALLENDLQMFVVKNVFEELCNREHKGYLVWIPGNRCILMINLKDNNKIESLIESLKEGQEFLKKNYQMITTIGFGGVSECMAHIHQSYVEATMALEYKYLMGEGSFIAFADVANREFSYITSVESKLSRMVIDYMREGGNIRTPEQFVAEVMESYGINEAVSMETIECFRYEIISVINKAVTVCGGTFDNKKNLIMELMEQPTLESFKDNFIRVITLLRQKEQENTIQRDICYKAMKYISENYRDATLSVGQLGKELNISASYLSKLFTEKYGVSIPDSLSQIRIQNSKKALKDTSKSIKEIAMENGFLSSNVYIKVFKKWEGVTPGVYRDLNHSSENE